jgi:signal peptidase II
VNSRVAGFMLGGVVLAADQLSKYWVLHGAHLADGHILVLAPILNLVLVRNHGITFGMFTAHSAAGTLLLAIAAIAVIAGLVVWLWRTAPLLNCLAIGAIGGGAIGNVADRLTHGAVVDFIQAHLGGVYFPYIFNVGDSAICCGVAVLMLDAALHPSPVAAGRGQR